MTFMCFFKGCTWKQASYEQFGTELLLCQCCARCGSRRHLPEATGETGGAA